MTIPQASWDEIELMFRTRSAREFLQSVLDAPSDLRAMDPKRFKIAMDNGAPSRLTCVVFSTHNAPDEHAPPLEMFYHVLGEGSVAFSWYVYESPLPQGRAVLGQEPGMWTPPDFSSVLDASDAEYVWGQGA